MSFIASEIDALLKEKKIAAEHLANKSGVASAQISRIRNGLQVWVSMGDLMKMSVALCSNQSPSELNKIHARLLAARLRDECTGPGAEHITISLNLDPRPVELNDSIATNYKVPPKIQQNLMILGEYVATNPKDLNIRQMIKTLAELCRNRSLPPSPAK